MANASTLIQINGIRDPDDMDIDKQGVFVYKWHITLAKFLSRKQGDLSIDKLKLN